MLTKLLYSLALFTLFVSSQAAAGDVVKWVDEQGVTHFGNAQFAPPGSGEALNIQPANGMDVPDTHSLNRGGSSGSPRVAVIKRKVTKNPRGFRGYSRRASNPNLRQRRRAF